MDKLRELYQQLKKEKGQEYVVMELSEKEHQSIIDEHLRQHFAHIGTTPYLGIEEFFEIQRTTEGLEGHILLRGRDDKGNVLYFEVKNIGNEIVQETLRRMEKGEELYLHVNGKDTEQITKKLEPYLKPVETKIKGKDIGYGQVYKEGDTYFVNTKVPNKLGIHLRPASEFVNKSLTYESNISVINSSKSTEVNGKSILGMMLLGASKETELVIKAEGADAEKAVKELYFTIQTFVKEDKKD